METRAVYFDGSTASDHEVGVVITAGGLRFSGPDTAPQDWSFAALTAIEPPQAGHPFRMANRDRPGARLVIRNDDFVSAMIAEAPHLRGGVAPRVVAKVAGWIAGGLAVVAALGYLTLQIAPQQLAMIMPDAWRQRIGEQVEASFVEGAPRCAAASGSAALAHMVARLTEGDPAAPAVSVRIYDIPVVNAFALPGGRVVVMSELIAKAAAPEEVAGVLAHELGHISGRHAEAQLIRATGLQLLLSAATGGGGGDTISTAAGLATILQYSRDAEREADAYAQARLEAAAIDPLGLKHFFERVLKEGGTSTDSTFGKIGSIFSTHPGIDDRIAAIRPLPDGVMPRPVLSDVEWQALKKICG
jgi:Zn-dependent protease with chaperone function